jgi:hypothetical protein
LQYHHTDQEVIMNNVTAIRFLVEYQMMGDMEGMAWMELVLSYAKKHELIQDYEALTSLTGVWGLQLCVFTFDVSVERIEGTLMDRDRDYAWATDLANGIVGDSDAEVRWAGTVMS